MKTTIGEILNELIPYASIIECKSNGYHPNLTAHLIDSHSLVRSYLYVSQTDEHTYSTCEVSYELHGNKYLSTKYTRSGLIQECDVINKLYSDKNCRLVDDNILTDVNKLQFIDFLYETLFKYDIPKISRKIFSNPLSDIRFSYTRVHRNLTNICKGYDVEDTIKGILSLVKDSNKKFDLSNMKEKDVKDIINKFNHIGVKLSISNRLVTDIQLRV